MIFQVVFIFSSSILTANSLSLNFIGIENMLLKKILFSKIIPTGAIHMRSKLFLSLNLRFYLERIWPNYQKVLKTSNQWLYYNEYLYFHFHKIDDEIGCCSIQSNIDGQIYRQNICNLNIPKNHYFYIFQMTATSLRLHFSKGFYEKHLQSLSLKMPIC